jgi:hypothetical protein
MLLKRSGKSWQEVSRVLQEYAASIDGAEGTEGASKRDIIGHLVDYMAGL